MTTDQAVQVQAKTDGAQPATREWMSRTRQTAEEVRTFLNEEPRTGPGEGIVVFRDGQYEIYYLL